MSKPLFCIPLTIVKFLFVTVRDGKFTIVDTTNGGFVFVNVYYSMPCFNYFKDFQIVF